MGFLDDLMGFGTTMNSGTQALQKFYRSVYYYFNLASPGHIKEGTKVPLKVTTGGWISKEVTSFEVHGNPTSTHWFTSNTRETAFNRIELDHPSGRGLAWIFDTTRLSQGILSGRVTTEGSADHIASQEYIKILYMLGATIAAYKQLSKVPYVQLGFGPLWERYGVPDQIFFSVESIYPFSDNDLLRANQVIIHNYSQTGAPLTYAYSGDPRTGTMTITPQEIGVEQPVAPAPPQHQPQSAPVDPSSPEQTAAFIDNLNAFVEGQPKSASAPAKEFPYDFYRGLGLIDADDMVVIDTILGPMRVHMTTNGAYEKLTNYKPEG